MILFSSFVKMNELFSLMFKEEKSLNFLLNPDLENIEEHRVYYVALSRAKKQLFINVPKLSSKLVDKIIGFEIVELN